MNFKSRNNRWRLFIRGISREKLAYPSEAPSTAWNSTILEVDTSETSLLCASPSVNSSSEFVEGAFSANYVQDKTKAREVLNMKELCDVPD